ncbi:MAG: PAS domain S-box protein [Proteobacteria bacterium]|nr:PAS domain S-box protein [Pseudomonadota bacterium]
MQLLELELCAALLLDTQGLVLRAGAGFESILGWPETQALGLNWASLAVPEHHERFERAFENVLQGAPMAVVRARFARPDGERSLVCRLSAADGGFLMVVEDVGERATVFTSQSNLQELVDYATDAWFVHDLEGRIRDANPWACKVLGYTREEMLALHVADFETTIQPGRLDGIWNRMEVGTPMSVEGLQRRKDGSTFPVSVRLGLFEAEDELLMLAICRDITKLKKAETELQQLNVELEDKVARRTRSIAIALVERQAMLDSLADGIVATGADGGLRMVNPALSKMLGMPVEVGLSVGTTLPPAIASVIRDALDTGRPATGEARLPGDRVVQTQASPIVHEGEVSGAVARVQDVTLEREVDRMKTDFIATVSHELRTPLTSVLGFAKITRNQLESKLFPHLDGEDPKLARAMKRVRNNIDIISSEGERLTALINDVLDISKMEAGRMEWSFAPIEVSSLVAQAADAASALFEADQLVVRIDPDLPAVNGDRSRLIQVLINLLSNAAKFSAGRAVELTASAEGDGVELSVRDHGEGIAPGLHDAVFERFKQVGDTLTDKPQGTGLGLPICQQIARAHDTEITIESQVGEGARFAVVLASVTAEASRVPHVDAIVRRIERKVPRTAASSERTILVVDDDPSIRELLRQELTDRGFIVRQASNGYEGIAAIRADRPDLVILDVMMPDLSGFDVAAMLKGDPKTESIPILMLSILEDTERGFRLGVDRYLTKPAQTDELVGAVRELLEQVSSPRRVLVVDETASMSVDVSRLLELRGYQVVGTCTGAECLDEAKRTKPDLIILESLVDSQEELLRTIRFERGLEHVYIVQLVEGAD